MTTNRIIVNMGVSVRNVPEVVATIFLVANEPAMASIAIMAIYLPNKITKPIAIL